MKKFKKKNSLIKKLILICLVYFVVSSFYSVFSQIHDYNKQIASLNSEIAQETANRKKLEEKKLKMNTDESYREIARKSLGLVAPGDKVYVNTNDNSSK